MDFSCYLAMTAAEFLSDAPKPRHFAWMACHFSSYSTGLSNIPRELPAGSMVIVNDRTPPKGHDKHAIARELNELAASCQLSGILLDLQRPEDEQTKEIAVYVSTHLECPVAVSDAYAKDCSCPVFLSMPPPHRTLADHIRPWKDRPIWLELALENERAIITREGCRFLPEAPESPTHFSDDTLHCRYGTKIYEDRIAFTLCRDRSGVLSVMQEAHNMGIVRFIGLYQQLGPSFPDAISQEKAADG